MAQTPKGKRADHLFRNRGVIIEQKDLYADRRNRIEKAFGQAGALLQKHDPENKWLRTFSTHGVGRQAADVAKQVSDTWPDEDRRSLYNALYGAGRFVEHPLSQANNQIKSTKNLLHIPHASGLVLFVNEQAGYFHPIHLMACIHRLLAQMKDDEMRRFPHIDGVLLFQKLQGFTIEGRGGVTLYISGPSENKAVDEFAEAVGKSFPPGKQTAIRRDMPLMPDYLRPMIQHVRVRIHPIKY